MLRFVKPMFSLLYLLVELILRTSELDELWRDVIMVSSAEG